MCKSDVTAAPLPSPLSWPRIPGVRVPARQKLTHLQTRYFCHSSGSTKRNAVRDEGKQRLSSLLRAWQSTEDDKWQIQDENWEGFHCFQGWYAGRRPKQGKNSWNTRVVNSTKPFRTSFLEDELTISRLVPQRLPPKDAGQRSQRVGGRGQLQRVELCILTPLMTAQCSLFLTFCKATCPSKESTATLSLVASVSF